jgi:hypothetical protein
MAIDIASFTNTKTEKRRICLIPSSIWRPWLSCPEQGGVDGQVLWVFEPCQPGKAEKNQAAWIHRILKLDESSKERQKNLARLMWKIYEVGPLTCRKGPRMVKVISSIEDERVIKKILKHLCLSGQKNKTSSKRHRFTKDSRTQNLPPQCPISHVRQVLSIYPEYPEIYPP